MTGIEGAAVNPDYWSEKYRAEGLIWGRKPTAGVMRFADFLAERKVLNVLEVGCGYGRDSAYLAGKGYNVTGVDASEEAIKLALKTRGTVFFLGDGDALEFPDRTFDAAWSSNFLHLFEKDKRDAILREMRRVLVKKGVLGFSVASVNDPNHGEGEKLGANTYLVKGKLMHFFEEWEIANAMEGFKILKLQEIDEEERHKNGLTHGHVNWFGVGEKA